MIIKAKKIIILLMGIILFIGMKGDLIAKKRVQKLIKSTPSQVRLQWYQSHLALKKSSIFKNLKWCFIGPEIMSGRVVDVAVPKGSKYTIYAGTASGGVWKTVNEGTTWEPIFEHAPSTSIGDIAVSPSRPDILWVGTGEANIFRSSMAGSGVYRSTDAGKTWQHMGLTGTHTIARIVIHPKNPDTVYVASSGHEWTFNKERGVFKTTDGGKNWEKVLYINEKTGIIDLVMDPSNSNILYASAWDRIRKRWSDPKPGDNDAIYKTTNGGENWKKIIDGLPPLKLVGRIGLDVSRSNPNVVYAFLDNHNPGRKSKPGERDSYGRMRTKPVIKGAEVYRSDNKGETWRKVSESSLIMERLLATYGWVFGQICVDPNDENTVYIMGVPLLKSTDGGKNFKRVSYPGLHGDHHALWIDLEDSNHVINGNDGGVNISYDAGKTWINYENLGVVQFYNVTVDMDKPFNVYGSIQDNGSYKGPVIHRPGHDPRWNWTTIPGGEASYLAVDPSNQNILYNESFYGRIRRSDLSGKTPKTVSIMPKVAEGESRLRGQWLAPFIISPHNPHVIYHGMQYVFRSMNRGDSWEKISPDLTYNDPRKRGDIPYATISTLSESPLKFGLLVVGTDDGKVHMTKDGGDTWTEIITGLPYNKHVSRVVASKFNESTFYLSLNGKRDDDFDKYLYKSTNYGRTWINIGNNLPCGPINVISEDPRNRDLLYVGTDLGVYISINGGKTWHSLCNNLPTTFVHDLIVHPRDNILVAATHGRGMFVLDVSSIQKYTPKIQAKKVHMFEIPEVEIPRRWWMPRPKATITYVLTGDQELTVTISDSKGKRVKDLKVKGKKGFNQIIWDLTGESDKSGRPRFVKKGVYTVKIKAGGLEESLPLAVK